jgi:hypothetical protein
MSIFAKLFRKSSIVLPEEPKPTPQGYFVATDWDGKKRVFYGFFCDICRTKFQTDLRENLKPSDVFKFFHCGSYCSITIRELDAANLQSVRTEPHHASGAMRYGDTTILPVGVGGDATTDGTFGYEKSDPWKGQ